MILNDNISFEGFKEESILCQLENVIDAEYSMIDTMKIKVVMLKILMLWHLYFIMEITLMTYANVLIFVQNAKTN